MKKLLLALFLLGTLHLSAQISLDPDPIVLDLNASEQEIVVDMDVINTGTKEASIWWELVLPEEPEGWRFYICDSEQCYGAGTLKNAPSKPNTVEANSTQRWTMHFENKSSSETYEGTYVPVMKLFNDSEHSNVIFETGAISSTENEALIDNIQLYPNPAVKYFNLSNDELVKEVGVYNIVGKEILREAHSMSQSHDVSDLQRGMYIVRLFDQNGSILRSQRLSKR